MTYSGSVAEGNFKMYFNGAEDTSLVFDNPATIKGSCNVAQNVFLGELNNAGSPLGYPVKGFLYNFAIYNSVLVGSDLATILNGGSVTTTDLKLLYEGYGKTDADWEDKSGNNYNGTIKGSPSIIRIPALADASADVAGGTILNPAWDGIEENNDSETSIDKNVELETGTVLSSVVEWDKQDMLHYNLFHGFTQAGDCSIPAIPGKI
ncbi:MAG: hypothetical protein OMM_01317 [Candidatus Magnetoglobus multicellularis str. Araruama]|uniref:Uncharacterized protein n=1 Tax=Candidatus Magnetoglobus multicellularis str. Araruama TaxID=890399 RepID=A0A1V1PDG7_9BACT|nr:MAG: hypothetical protein OMM_01317 [Candidatus Magnetoglobus multicellularis str. Araruama]